MGYSSCFCSRYVIIVIIVSLYYCQLQHNLSESNFSLVFQLSYLYIYVYIKTGYDEESLQKSCCGIGGDYKFNLMKMCGAAGVEACPNPNEHISWDGVHLTQNTYKFMTHWLIHHIFPKLHCSIL